MHTQTPEIVFFMSHLDNFTTSIKEFPVDRNISAEGLGARAHI